MNEYEEKIIEELVKNVPIKEVYKEFASPTLIETGKLISILPTVINACLSPFQIWTEQRNYNATKTKLLLEQKLNNIKIEDIIEPKLHIAAPILQAIEYCCDCDELRNMYSSLLASSIDANRYMTVYPAYVEIIKQLSPDEAKILNHLPVSGRREPMIDIEVEMNQKNSVFMYFKNITIIAEECICERPNNVSNYIENLTRLGLVEIPHLSFLIDEWRYNKIYESDFYLSKQIEVKENNQVLKIFNHKKSFGIADFGNTFRNLCNR